MTCAGPGLGTSGLVAADGSFIHFSGAPATWATAADLTYGSGGIALAGVDATGLGAAACLPVGMVSLLAGAGGAGAVSNADDGRQFAGMVKAFNEEKGWGHITCEETKLLYGKDIFVMRSALRCGKISAGHAVRFCVTTTARGPQATEVFSLEAGADWSSQDVVGRAFFGKVKLFSEEKGWGFIECVETHKMFGKDMFVHKREFGSSDISNGSRIQFFIEIGKDGRPEAKTVSATKDGLGLGGPESASTFAPSAGTVAATSVATATDAREATLAFAPSTAECNPARGADSSPGAAGHAGYSASRSDPSVVRGKPY